MTDRDDELTRVLRKWEAPATREQLDSRMWNSYRDSKAPRQRTLLWKFLPVAAGVALVAGLAAMWRPDHPVPAKPRSVSIETTTDAEGFKPIPNGAISVVRPGAKQ